MRLLKVSEGERTAIIHSLQETYRWVKEAEGNQYGLLTLEELENLINRLQNDADLYYTY